MLKITYTETGLHLEHLTHQTLEEWITTRVLLTLKTGHPLVLQHCTASFIVPADSVERYGLDRMIKRETADQVYLSDCDIGYLDVTMKGIWIASHPDDTEGAFVTVLSSRFEATLMTLWQEIQRMSLGIRCRDG